MKTRLSVGIALACALAPAFAIAQTQPLPSALGSNGWYIQNTPVTPCVAPSGGGGGACAYVAPDKPLPTAGQYGASGISPVSCTITSATTCGPLTPIAGRDFNVSTWGTFVASFQLERSFDGGTTWLPITAAGTQLYVWTAPESESASESEYGIKYRLNVTSYTSGTLNVRISQ